MILRGILSQNWPKYLPTVVKSLNDTPLKKLGYLKPNSIHSEIDSVKVQELKKVNSIVTYNEPNIEIQHENKKVYEKESTNFQVNGYVYLDFDEK